jgi:hypothetical protein
LCKPVACLPQPCALEHCPVRYWPCPKARECAPCPDLAHLWLRFEELLRQNRIAFLPSSEPLGTTTPFPTTSGTTSSEATSSASTPEQVFSSMSKCSYIFAIC